MKVIVYGLSKEGEDEEKGSFQFRGGKIVANPSDSPLLNGMLKESLQIKFEGKIVPVSPSEHPELWLKMLHRQYSSAYLRASKVEEVSNA